MTARTSRRGFLLGAAGTAIAAASGISFDLLRAAPPAPERLAVLLSGSDASVAIGREYLRARPAEAAPQVLASRLLASLPDGGRALERASEPELRGALARCTELDFDHGRTATVDGWVLARTEARLCALAAVLTDHPSPNHG